jgi:hypothetical protein
MFLERKQRVLIMEGGEEIATGQAPETVSEITKHSGTSKYSLWWMQVSPAHKRPELAYCHHFYLEP